MKWGELCLFENAFCPSHSPQRDWEGERGCGWKRLLIINCISIGYLFIIYHLWGMLLLDGSNHPRLSQKEGWEAEALCCCSASTNCDAFLCMHTQSTATSVFKLASVFLTPLGQNCLPHSVARRPRPSPQQSLCRPWMMFPLLCTTASAVHNLHLPTLVNGN